MSQENVHPRSSRYSRTTSDNWPVILARLARLLLHVMSYFDPLTGSRVRANQEIEDQRFVTNVRLIHGDWVSCSTDSGRKRYSRTSACIRSISSRYPLATASNSS